MRWTIVILVFCGLLGFGLAEVSRNGMPDFGLGGEGAAVASASRLPDPATRRTGSFVEQSDRRARCMTYRVEQTIMEAGVSPPTSYLLPDKKAPQCRAPSGYRSELDRYGKCRICPTGMYYTAMLRDRKKMLDRMGLSHDVCISTRRTCLDEN